MLTGGFIFIHAVSHALCPHLVWTLENLTHSQLKPRWYDQPQLPGTACTVYEWQGEAGTAATIASALFRVQDIYFEVTEKATSSTDSSRHMHTPSLGIFHAHTDVAGNFVITEEQVKHAYEVAGTDTEVLYQQLALALGQAWDQQLEPLRASAHTDGLATVTYARFM